MHPRPATARVLLLLGALAIPLSADQLITRTFSTRDGLPHNNRLGDILQDSRGFLWIATQDGVSRFDGRQFQNFGVDDGLGYPLVNQICETRNRVIWLATNGAGVARYEPFGAPGARFTRHPTGNTTDSNAVNGLAEDSDGGLWAATDSGLFRLNSGDATFQPVRGTPADAFSSVVGTPGGVTWAVGRAGLFRISRDGLVSVWKTAVPSPTGALYLDRAGKLWALSARGVVRINPTVVSSGSPVLAILNVPQTTRGLFRMVQDRSGGYWITGYEGLYYYDGRVVQHYGPREGVPGHATWGLAEDRQGNLWVGVEGVGLLRIARGNVRAWSTPDGLADARIYEVFRLPGSAVGVLTLVSGVAKLQAFNGVRASALAPPIPTSRDFEERPALVDRTGDLWIAVGGRVLRLRPGSRVPLPDSTPAGGVFEDRSGDIWLAGWSDPFGLARWVRSEDRVEDFRKVAGTPFDPWTLDQDPAANVWIGGVRAGVYRFRDGRFVSVESPFPPGQRHRPYCIHVDVSGRVWVGYTRGGLAVVENRDSAQPRLRAISWSGDAMQSPVLSLTSDLEGRLYIGSISGLWIYEPRSGRAAPLGEAIPVLAAPVYSGIRDDAGDMWFGTDNGLVRLTPSAAIIPTPPPVRFTQIRLTDGLLPLSGWGQETLDPQRFPDWRNRFEFSFSAFGEAGPWRYRYRLEPHDRDWIPTPQSTVIYQQLPPGSYRFRVQSMGPAGEPSAREAVFAFSIEPHLWQRWWFLLLCVLATGALAYALYRYRLNQILAVERVRMRIATDLHDDIGSALSHIGLLSEVARTREDSGIRTLERIAEVSRQTSAAIADIVWTINPERESLGDLTVRIRRFAVEMFSPLDIALSVIAPEPELTLKLGLDTRRQLLLIAKEAIHNVVKHSGASNVRIALHAERGDLVFRVEDDGKGFDAESCAPGHGLQGMRSRVAAVGGRFSLQTSPGAGVCLEVRVPLK